MFFSDGTTGYVWVENDPGLWQDGAARHLPARYRIFVVSGHRRPRWREGASLWAWLLLIALVLPIAFYLRPPRAALSPRGALHLIGLAFGNGAERFSAFLFLAVLPVACLPPSHHRRRFLHALFDMGEWTLWGIQLLTLLGVFLLGLRGARSSGNLQLLIALAILGLTPCLSGSRGIQLARCRPASANGERMARHGARRWR